MYRKRWVIQYLGNIFTEGLVVNGLYLLEIVKRKLIIVLFTGSAVLISSSDPTLGVATLFSAKEISGPKLVALFFCNSIVALKAQWCYLSSHQRLFHKRH